MINRKLLVIPAIIFLFAQSVTGQTLQELFENGKKAFYSDQFDSANILFSQILSRESNDYEVCFYKGLVYEVNFDNDKAITELTCAITMKPKSSEAYLKRASIYDKQLKFTEAINDYTGAIKYDKKNTDAYFYRASDYQELKQFNEAIKDYSRVIKLNPSEDIAFYNRGLLYKELKNSDKAINDFETAIRIDKIWEHELRPKIDSLKTGQ
ncbi:MAG: tetratricopeptide repeat protein [Ignavibacteria bacterium]